MGLEFKKLWSLRSGVTLYGRLWSFVERHGSVGAEHSHSLLLRRVQGYTMTQRQLVLVRLVAVSLWLLRMRLVDTIATWVRSVLCVPMYTPRPIPPLWVGRLEHPFASAIVAQSGGVSVPLVISSISLVVACLCQLTSSPTSRTSLWGVDWSAGDAARPHYCFSTHSCRMSLVLGSLSWRHEYRVFNGSASWVELN